VQVTAPLDPRPERDDEPGDPPTRPLPRGVPKIDVPGATPPEERWWRRAWRRVTAPRPPVPDDVVVIRGKPRPVVRSRPKPPLLGRRLAVVYDTVGPRVTLGVLWFGAVLGALVAGPVVLVPLYAAMAALAGFQAASAWRAEGSQANRWVAALAGALAASGAAWGVGSLGLAVVVATLVALVAAAVTSRVPGPALAAAGTTLQSGLPGGIGAAGLVLTLRLEIGAAVTLVLLVAAYEVGDYLVGSGAASSIEGPIAGIVAIAAMSFVIAVLRVPPFDGVPALVFGGFAALGCPLGQVVASALLPRAEAHAPALRRLDSLLLLGPAWPLLVGLLLQELA
jgi:hypothetical protein